MKHQNESITYTERDGIFYPDLAVPEQTDYPIGKYGTVAFASTATAPQVSHFRREKRLRGNAA